ncbi:hypothetical protein [Microvirga sp. TS319]|uniref:hypothetical protein n=1 Tax=Microvirga sp. TS319 TaxID=3241165 RepID=UPI00351A0F50
MKATMLEKLIGDEPSSDPAVRLGRLIGTIVGLPLYPMFVWIVVDGFFRTL